MENQARSNSGESLRVALVAGTLGKGGAEKQLVYIASALKEAGVQVRVYSLTQGEFYEQALVDCGIAPAWIGQSGSPVRRTLELWKQARAFRPHIIQSTHFYTNLYAALVGRMLGVISIGALRNNTTLEIRANGRWGPLLMRLPQALIANSHPARENAIRAGYPAGHIGVLTNVIDLDSFDRTARGGSSLPFNEPSGLCVVLVARLVPFKRVDRFLRVLALARQQAPGIHGLVIGDGMLRAQLEAQAAELGLLPDGVFFAGERHDVPTLLSRCDALVLTSDEEGFPNVILEGMAAGLPVISTAVGEAPSVVDADRNGYIVPKEDETGMAGRLVALARGQGLRQRMGQASRRRVEQLYSYETLAPRLLDLYEMFARGQNRRHLVRLIERGTS